MQGYSFHGTIKENLPMSMGSPYVYPQENPQMNLAEDDLCFMVIYIGISKYIYVYIFGKIYNFFQTGSQYNKW